MELLQEIGLKEVNLGGSDGKSGWFATSTAEITAINPTTGKKIASIVKASAQDYERIITTATQTFKTWREVPAPKRAELIRLIAVELRAKKDVLADLVSLESGKIRQEGAGEVQEMIDIADFAVGESRMLFGKVIQSERPRHRMIEQWHPLGPIGVITAFNFPVAVWSWNALIAAVCGDCVIWKPSPKGSLCAIAIQTICNAAMKELGYEGVFSLLITDEVPVIEGMMADKRLPLISFTGSTAVGKKVAVTVAERFGKTILELSGNNGVIVDKSADFNLAIPSIVFGAVGTAGQRCTSTRRVIVHETRYDELVQQLVNVYQQVKIGDPLDSATLMGPLIDKHAVTVFQQAIEEIKKQGGQILFGGEVLEKEGNFVQPTLVAAHKNMPIIKTETFAPILYLLKFKDLPEAIGLHNDVPQGLSSAIFTEDLKNAEYFISVLGSDCGIANVNIGTSGAEIGGAFGGEKETGGGRESGSDAWQFYMRRQTSTINWSKELPLAQGIKFDIRVEHEKF